jgi:hypothetical protein
MGASLESFGRQALVKLLDAGERTQAGVRSRAAALTTSGLALYRSTASLPEKEAFENVVLAASAAGAIELQWDSGYVPKGGRSDGFISRIDLRDIEKLAQFLGHQLTGDKIRQAAKLFAPLLVNHSVLSDVISRWSQLKTVRGLWPDDFSDWLDAAIVVDYTKAQRVRDAISAPIRETSATLFKDSKRIEKLASAVDILLSGDIDAAVRPAEEVWKEIGLFREELPVRLAGNVSVIRSRVTALLDAPYGAFAAESILGLTQDPLYILSIENQTTFHSEARRLCQENVLLLYTNGMPSPKWRAMYLRILASTGPDVSVKHWGDIDEGGFRIAAILANDVKTLGRTLKPEKMNPHHVPEDAQRTASDGTICRMRKYALQAGWLDLADAIQEKGITVEQEAL